jgi:hypothetical protein
MCLGGACVFCALLPVVSSPFASPREEPVVCELCVCGWFLELVVKLLSIICIAFLLCILAFALHMYHDVLASLYLRSHCICIICIVVGKAYLIYFVHHNILWMI